MTEMSALYGRALYALAQETHKEEIFLTQLRGTLSILRQVPDYMRLIANRAVPKAERLSLLDEAFGGRVEPDFLSFLKLLCEHGLFLSVEKCVDAFVEAYHADHGIVRATAISSVPLDEGRLTRLHQALEKKAGKQVELSVKVDPSVRAGMRVEMEGIRYDNTLSSRMERLRHALTEGTLS